MTVGPAVPVALPWRTRTDHRCFGCAPGNPHGLGLTFSADGNGLRTDFDLGHHYESYPGVVHGGIVALICDETMGNLIVLRDGTPAVTTSLRMRYVGTVHVGRPYRVTAVLSAVTEPMAGSANAAAGGLVKATADVTDARGDVVASATATYHPVS
ncbi:PaaI family thioesterase [Pseudonocardia kujensis]|uniref:PaaI family thioesterase n=1 Tax=Pseudonocardia kujensis TaxID=1128675 RepID=UPI001E2FF189|nr:PaaI family thioesterase [Pseudonocardia kujensis]MCE0764853.1 PaaI family thioesterase [Pseudonocardia kujensis]